MTTDATRHGGRPRLNAQEIVVALHHYPRTWSDKLDVSVTYYLTALVGNARKQATYRFHVHRLDGEMPKIVPYKRGLAGTARRQLEEAITTAVCRKIGEVLDPTGSECQPEDVHGLPHVLNWFLKSITQQPE